MKKIEISITKNWNEFSCLYKFSNTLALNVKNIIISKEEFEYINKVSLDKLNDILSNLYEK